jgi:hypothetical protein
MELRKSEMKIHRLNQYFLRDINEFIKIRYCEIQPRNVRKFILVQFINLGSIFVG